MDTERPSTARHHDWMRTRVKDLDDGQLDRAAHAAFAWLRRRTARRNTPVDRRTIDRIVLLQREHLRRFPDGDLSVPLSTPVDHGACGSRSEY